MVEQRVQRRLAAVFAADVVGYSRLMERDEAGTLGALKECRAAIVDPIIAEYGGRIVKLMGDGTLAEFASILDAVQCAVEMQQAIAERNVAISSDRKIEFRIGINLGDVILEEDDIYGDGVNVAARLEGLAEPGGICVSGTVFDAVGNKLSVRSKFMGERQVKNIEAPIRTYYIYASDEPLRTSAREGSPRPSSIISSQGRKRHQPTLAVKPFDNLSGELEQGDYAFAISHGIITALIRVPGLLLIGDETPSFAKSKQMTVDALARHFDVQFVLSGAVRKLGNMIRVSAALMDVSAGRYLWAEDFDRTLEDLGELFAIQDEITAEIVTALDVQLLSGEAGRIVRQAFENPLALKRYYQGEQRLWSSASGLELREAQRLFEEAVDLEPTASVGYAGGAIAHWTEATSGLSSAPDRSLERASDLAREALKLEDVTGYPHLVLAHVHLNKRAFDMAAEEADRAVFARPSCPGAYSLKASVLNYLGRPTEAIEFAQYAVRLTPVRPPDYPAVLASAYFGAGLYEDAVAAAKASIALDEDNLDSYLVLTASNQILGRSEEARWAAQQVLKLSPKFNLADFAANQPFKEQRDLDHLIEQLRAAGLE